MGLLLVVYWEREWESVVGPCTVELLDGHS